MASTEQGESVEATLDTAPGGESTKEWRSVRPVRAPDFVEPIVGWRLWLVVSDGGYFWLESMLYPVRWMPRRALDARCHRHRRCHPCRRSAEAALVSSHPAPAEACECGIYASRLPETLTPYLDSTYPGRGVVERVLGRVRLWGRVVAAERGWRGEHAYPDAIYVPHRDAADASAVSATSIAAGLGDYGVPVLSLPPGATPETIALLKRAS
jgi:hypothetical protein